MDKVDPPMRVALDRFSVPALRPGFGAQVVAMATASEPATGDSLPPPRRDPRGGWRRRGRLLIGAGALILASATAAATGMFGPLPHTLPELAHVFVTAPPPMQPAHPRKAVALRKSVSAPALVVIPQAVPPATDLLTRRAVIRDRLLAIRAARIAAGEPVRLFPKLQPQDRATRIARRQAFAAAHPAIAARIVERVRERRRNAVAMRMDREQFRQAPVAGVDPSATAPNGQSAIDQSTVAAPDAAPRLERLRRLRELRERRRAARIELGLGAER